MIVVCSIRDLATYKAQLVEQTGREPIIYRTTVGKNYGMGKYENVPCFNPSWDIVLAHKNGQISDAQYLYGYFDPHKQRSITGYYDILKKRSRDCFKFVRDLQADEDYILLCYCAEGRFCHRRIIAEKIRKHRPELEVVVH